MWSLRSVSVLYVFISVLSTCSPKVLEYRSPFLMKSTCFCFYFLFLLFFWTLQDKLIVHPVCTWMHYEMSVQKKKKRRKKLEKNKRIKKVVVFVQILFFLSRQKNTDTERSGQRIKSLFFILYICMEIKIPVCCIALLYKSNVLVAFF